MNYYKTHILKILIYRKLLKDRLSFLFGQDADEIEAFLRDILSGDKGEPSDTVKKHLPLLLKHGYISAHNPPSHGRCSLMGVKAVNFELTYRCTCNCRHCLQKNIRHDPVNLLSTEKVKEAILEAYLSGLCTAGMNFTGGEVLGNRDDLFELLRYAQSLKIAYRLNTNSWWAREAPLKISGLTFTAAIDLVEYLKSIGLNQFAFSYDARLENTGLMNNLVESIRLCETAKVFYQLIFTGINPLEINDIILKLKTQIGHNLYYLIPIYAEMVDIGGASDFDSRDYGWQTNKCTCERKGFYHPYLLHISPGGKVRTCMYAIGSSDVGDLTQKPLAEIINEFPGSRNGQVFANPDKNRQVFEMLVEPYLGLYRPIIHGCTRNVILARTVEMGGGKGEPELEGIHREIGRELNLGRSLIKD